MRHLRKVGPFWLREDRELAGMVLALIETGTVVVYPDVLGEGPDEWGTRDARGNDPSSWIRQLPGVAERGRTRRGRMRTGGPTMIADQLPGLGWVELSEHDEHGIRVVSLTELGAQWLTFCRGNTGVLDVSRFAWARSTAQKINERARAARGTG